MIVFRIVALITGGHSRLVMAHSDSLFPDAPVQARPLPDDRFATALLTHYDRHRRHLPWRALPGETADPYRVWLSEIMLQQTTVQAVIGYFQAFLARWPTVEALAAAPLESVLEAWAGLGYYARARNLHACARAVAELGRFPDTADGLKELPGIGDYTAGAIAAIAFGRAQAAVDGNVERVISRAARITTPLPKAKAEIKALTTALVPAARPGDFAQAMMDLGATICLPKAPLCSRCPVSGWCQAAVAGDALRYPVKAAKAERPTRHGVAYVIKRADGAVLLRRRPEKGLLGGMMEVPGTIWAADPPANTPPFSAHWHQINRPVEHTFTHFHLILTVAVTEVLVGAIPAEGEWYPRERLATAALPSLFRKVLKAAGV